MVCVVFAGLSAAASVLAADAVRAPFVGRPVTIVLEAASVAGETIAYSSRLVPPDLLVEVEPAPGDPLSVAREVLDYHSLALQYDDGVYLVVRQATAGPLEPPQAEAVAGRKPAIEKITVVASRYEISRDISTSNFQIDRRTIQNMPDVGQDPVRVTHRLPGAAASGASARAHFRGGEQAEVGIILNGHRLFDPFHVRDYQNIFSAIDARAIESVEVFTGGFPVMFGDRMSGLVLMESIDPTASRHTEIGLSVFNTSFLHVSANEDRRWLLSARRGNLDLIIDPTFGEPSYYDVFTQLQMRLTPTMQLSANGLYADDLVTVVLEAEPDEIESASSRTRNAQFWVQLDNDWSDKLSSSTTLSFVAHTNRRRGELGDAEKIVAAVTDIREIEQFGIRQDWRFAASETHLLHWGLDFRSGDSMYDYSGQAEYFQLQALYPGNPGVVDRTLGAAPNGASYALYFADRRRLSAKTTIEWGLRWDDQSYTDHSSDSQLSPRFSVLWQPMENTELRMSWGRYHQSQGLHELQIEDGVTNFWPAQSADHLIVGLSRRFSDKLALRLEAFHKNMRDVRPRYENLYDPLALIPELQADRIRLEPTRATAEGIEVSLLGEHEDWSWWASYTLSKVTDTIDGEEQLRSWDQRHALQAGVSWSSGAWDAALALGVHTGWPSTDLRLEENGTDANGDTIYVAVPGPRNALRHGTFGSLDARLSRRFNVPHGSLLAFVEVSNLSNRRNVCCSDWDIAVDNNTIPELESSPDYWLPLLPAIGVLWEF
ncbi:MAG: TonB-dependent receptor [Gammaproteobacteria bacterium]|nr:TonB-dependent receptor [Gammaproteobacteria bacterium]